MAFFYRALTVVGSLLSTSALLTAQINLVASPNPSVFGQPVTLAASVSSIDPNSVQVSFYDGVNLLGSSAAVGGSAGFTTAMLPPGTHQLTARFAGTVATVQQSVRAQTSYAWKAPRPIVVSISPNAAARGQAVDVAITGQNTYFTGGAPQVLAGSGITVSHISVNSATSITAQLRIASDAVAGPRSVTVTVPVEIEATLPNGFTVQ